jgi:hypothetical protein
MYLVKGKSTNGDSFLKPSTSTAAKIHNIFQFQAKLVCYLCIQKIYYYIFTHFPFRKPPSEYTFRVDRKLLHVMWNSLQNLQNITNYKAVFFSINSLKAGNQNNQGKKDARI